MLIHLGNIVAGFILAAPKIKTWFKSEQAETQVGTVETKLNTFRGTIGIIELVLGILVILRQLNIVFFSLLGYGLLQGLFAVVMGLLLGAEFFQKYPSVRDKIAMLQPYSEWIGVAGIAVGIFGLV